MNAIAKPPMPDDEALFAAVAKGDLSCLTTQQKLAYYNKRCKDLGLNPLNQPFQWLLLQGKLTLYANRACTEELRATRHISLEVTSREVQDDCYVVTVKARTPDGRVDENIGAVTIAGLKGEQKANAMMKAHTKACRRATLSICGLGLLDETEVQTIPSAKTLQLSAGEYEKQHQHILDKVSGATSNATDNGGGSGTGEKSPELETAAAPVESQEVTSAEEAFEFENVVTAMKHVPKGLWLSFSGFDVAVDQQKWLDYIADKGIKTGWTVKATAVAVKTTAGEVWRLLAIYKAEPGATPLEKDLADSVEKAKKSRKKAEDVPF